MDTSFSQITRDSLLSESTSLPRIELSRIEGVIAAGSLLGAMLLQSESLYSNPNVLNAAMTAMQFIQLSTMSAIVYNNLVRVEDKGDEEQIIFDPEHIPTNKVAVIIPTYNEPKEMVLRTLRSVAEQTYSGENLIIILSDDSYQNAEEKHSHEAWWVRELGQLEHEFPGLTVRYNVPPSKSSPERKGNRKAGNMNSALDLIRRDYPGVEYMINLDADDLMPHPSFISAAVQKFNKLRDSISYLQSAKSNADKTDNPYNHLDDLFFDFMQPNKGKRGTNIACGSGMMIDLTQVGSDFYLPAESLVEDFTFSMRALNEGKKGSTLPMNVEAQAYPQDLKNLLNQRKLWARDQLQWLLDKQDYDYSALKSNFPDYLDAAELPIGIIYSVFTMLVASSMALADVTGLTDMQVISTGAQGLLATVPLAFLAKRGIESGTSAKSIAKAVALFNGLSPHWARILASEMMASGPGKHEYKATRKDIDTDFAFREFMPNVILIGIMLTPLLQDVIAGDKETARLVMDNIFFLFYALMQLQFVSLAFHRPEPKSNTSESQS